MYRLIFLLLLILLLTFVSTLQARIINVPADSTTIQGGINGAVDGDTVLVADGTYTGDGNRDIDFTGKAIVVMSENGPEVTIIDCEGDYYNQHRGFYFHSGEGSNSVVQGFTITNGWADWGGGMHNNNSSPTVTNCTFSGNTAEGYGGGMYNGYNSSPIVTNCMFIGNSSESQGGGMHNGYNSSPTVTNCMFIGNSAGNSGGGMSNKYGSSPTITDCTFIDNWTFSDDGGGMFNFQSNPTITNCTFSGNSANWDGGGMYNSSSSPTVTNCIFSGNNAINAGCGGGMVNFITSKPMVTNCTFSGNKATYGGGMYNNSSDPTITNCTFSDNWAEYRGGGMYNEYSSDPTITNCILWGNLPDQIYDYGSGPIVTYSDVQGGYPGVGNIDTDPIFFTLGEFECFLDAGSPCIDAGGPRFSSYNNPTSDSISDWHPRWPDWIPNGPRPDMGAYGGPGNVGWLQ